MPTPAPLVVFVVEDNPLIRLLIVENLTNAGVEVLEAAKGEDAIDCLRGSTGVDVLFTDIQLAGRLTGWDVADCFRKLYPDKRIIYTSGKAPDPARQIAGTEFYGKPYNIAAVVEACLGRFWFKPVWRSNARPA